METEVYFGNPGRASRAEVSGSFHAFARHFQKTDNDHYLRKLHRESGNEVILNTLELYLLGFIGSWSPEHRGVLRT